MKLETIAGEWASRSNVRPLAKGGTSSRYFRMERACRPGFLNYGHTSRMSHLPGSRTNEKRSRPVARLPNVIIGNAGNRRGACPRGIRRRPMDSRFRGNDGPRRNLSPNDPVGGRNGKPRGAKGKAAGDASHTTRSAGPPAATVRSSVTRPHSHVVHLLPARIEGYSPMWNGF